MKEPIFEFDINVSLTEDTLVNNIARQLKQGIFEGKLFPDQQLPPTRKLSQRLGVSRNTILEVYQQLTSEDLLYSVPGGGCFVKAQPTPFKAPTAKTGNKQKFLLHSYWQDQSISTKLPLIATKKYDLRVGYPDTDSFPHTHWRKALNRISRQIENNEKFTTGPQGSVNLRKNIATHLSISRAIHSDPGQICITSGAQQAIDIIARILVSPGKTKIAIEAPGYPMAYHAFRAAGAEIVAIPIDEKGVITSEIPRDINLLYCTPSHQFPMGMAMTIERRAALLSLAESYNFAIIEDDYDAEFRVGKSPIDALKSMDNNDRVFYVGTFSKCLTPDLRLGYSIIPKWAEDAFVCAKFQMDWQNSTLVQESLANFMQSGELTKYLRKMRKSYSQRYQTLRDYFHDNPLPGVSFTEAYAGVHTTLLLEAKFDSAEIVAKAEKLDIAINSISDFQRINEPRFNGLILGYGLIKSEDIIPALDRLFSILQDY